MINWNICYHWDLANYFDFFRCAQTQPVREQSDFSVSDLPFLVNSLLQRLLPLDVFFPGLDNCV